jgi:gas vesicle protein
MMKCNRIEYSFATLALSFVIGGLVGAGLGLLFAPRTGMETREKIKERGGESLGKLQDMVERIWKEGKGLPEVGKEKFSEVKERVQETLTKIEKKFFPKKEEVEGN